jgi:hypothetical protein
MRKGGTKEHASLFSHLSLLDSKLSFHLSYSFLAVSSVANRKVST